MYTVCTSINTVLQHVTGWDYLWVYNSTPVNQNTVECTPRGKPLLSKFTLNLFFIFYSYYSPEK